MTLHVNIPLSSELYEQAQKMARDLDKEVPEFLADHLAQTLSEMAGKPQTAPERERAAYLALHPMLLANYQGEYVAIYQGELLDHDKEQLALVNRLDQTHPDQFVLVRQVAANPEPEYRRIAIRWAD